MELFLIALQRVVVMLLLMLVGVVLFKTKMLTEQGSKDLAHILLYAILPCVLMEGFCTEYTAEKTRWLLYSFGISAVVLLLSIVLARLFFRHSPVDNMGTAFCNAGFLGLPLLQAVLGEEAVIFSIPFVAILNILQATYGVALLKGEKGGISVKSVLKNPVPIGTAVGMVLYFLRIQLPGAAMTTMSMIADMNAPVAMIILGTYLAQTDVFSAFRSFRMLRNAIPRLVVVPLATVALLSVLPRNMLMAKMAILIVSITPTGTLVAVYSQLHDMDYTYACKVVCISTLLSVVTMPLIILLAGAIW